MVDLSPPPESLGLASPALGPWFHTDANDPLPELGLPGADLSIGVSLAAEMEWRAPAGCTVSYFIATQPRPSGIASLRQENGTSAFTDGDVVVVLRLLPEAELRLHALCSVLPSPDGATVAASTPTRPRTRYLAMAMAASSVPNVSVLENLRERDFPVGITSDEDKAGYVGLAISGGNFANGDAPTTELHRPASDSAVILKNRTGSTLGMTLWAFDYRGRPLDAGAVASWWSHLASPGIFDNLWAEADADLQRTAATSDGNVLHLTNAHEGPIRTAHLNRLTRSGLTQTSGSLALFQVGNPASIRLSAAPDPDDAPVPRLALLPHSNYGTPDTIGTTLFNGWHDTTTPWPATLNRDFVRVAMLDIESHLVGLDRTDDAQASARTRIRALRNTSTAPLAATTDRASQLILDVLAGGTNAAAMSPVMDTHWGALLQGSFGSEELPDTLEFTVRALRGAGSTDGGTASDQQVLVHFPDDALPAGAWVRCWPHALDSTTGNRFRQDGGGALADAAGEAFLVMAIPDGTAAPTAADADPVRLSFDALVVTDDEARYYLELRYDRPAVVAGNAVALPASPGIPPNTTLWIAEQGQSMTRASNTYGAGQTLLALPDDRDNGDYALIDLDTLSDDDVSVNTLRHAADNDDTLVVTTPAFQTTREGDVTASPGPGGSSVVRRTRNAFTDVDTFGRPAPLMERREVLGIDAGNDGAAIGSTPGRSQHHEASPATQGHPGMPAAAEIHGMGVDLQGPASDPVNTLMQERTSASLADYVGVAQAPLTPITDNGGTTTFAAVLETLTFGVTGDAIVRAFLDTLPSFTPGQSWLDLKDSIETATGFDFDPHIDSANFDDDTLAAGIDRVILKTRDGASQAATALDQAIRRAEDFIYIETPAIDPLSAGSGGSTVDIINAINVRRLDQPALKVLICVPENFLPGQPKRLEEIRKAGIAAAMKSLTDLGSSTVELFTPIAGSGRPLHMASTTVIVDDVFALVGSTHLWRRGLTYDSSVAVALMDETVSDGRSAAIRSVRRQLFSDRLGLSGTAGSLTPDDPDDMIAAVRATNQAGGLLRVKPNAYPPAEDTTDATALSIWNPDGKPGAVSDWFLFFGALTGDVAEEVNNAVR